MTITLDQPLRTYVQARMEQAVQAYWAKITKPHTYAQWAQADAVERKAQRDAERDWHANNLDHEDYGR